LVYPELDRTYKNAAKYVRKLKQKNITKLYIFPKKLEFNLKPKFDLRDLLKAPFK